MFSKKDTIAYTIYRLTLSLTVVFVALQAAHATVGETADSVEKDRLQFSGPSSLVVTNQALFTTYTFTANGNTIKEFVDNNTNVVFAVTWRGLSHPDLSKLIGKEYAAFSEKMAAQPKGQIRKSRTVTTANLTVQRGGHMRDWHGSAVMTSLLPAGVKTSDLK